MAVQNSRRSFIKLTGLGVTLGSLGGFTNTFGKIIHAQQPVDSRNKIPLAMATYSLRGYPLSQMLQLTKRVGLTKLSVKEMHMPLKSSKEEIIKATNEIKQAGLDLYTVGVIYMTNEEEVNRAFEYAKTAGVEMIVGVPEYPLLPLAEQKVKEYNIKLAIHNHGPNDKRYPSPADVYDRVKNMDPRLGLCLDIGHTMRLGIDPSESFEKYFDRILDVHIKDVNSANAEGTTVEMGRGVIDIPKFLRTLTKMNYKGTCAFEFEKDKDDPLAGIAESVGYTKGVLSAI